jgi:hypothetical protein
VHAQRWRLAGWFVQFKVWPTGTALALDFLPEATRSNVVFFFFLSPSNAGWFAGILAVL